ncbi:MAG: zf-HC2 domain-containing protein [Planctomycetaceae bacterium]|nr:zf-HC2 domain-containing protein [Planctomycetaceae bacterium]
MVRSLKVRRRHETYQRAAVVTSAMLVVAFVASSLVSGWFRGQDPAHQIACKEVLQLAPRYVAHELDSELTTKIDHHLGRCPRCRDKIHAAYPKFSMPTDAVSFRHSSPLPLAVFVKTSPASP